MIVRMPPELLPSRITFVSFISVLADTNFLHWVWNTLVVAGSVSFMYTILCAMAGYAFAQKIFPGRDVIFWIIISTLMLPFFSYLVPLYLLVIDIGIVNTYWAMILPAMAGPFGIFLMKQYMTTFPAELSNAAKIDGCNELSCFIRIVLPVCKPGVVFLAVIVFIAQWNNFLWPLIATTGERYRVLQVGIATFAQHTFTDYGLTMSAATLAALPIIILFFIFQRHIVGGISIGAIKG